MTPTHTSARRPLRRSAGIAAAVLALAGVATACPPADGGIPATTTTTIPGQASITVSKTAKLNPEGETITVDGTGFDPTAHVGARPPFAGQPSGVYVVFGKFADDWKPSGGAPSGARQVIQQVWALPQAQYDSLGGATNPALALLNADGTFRVQVPVLPSSTGTNRYGIAVYPGSGATNPLQEVLVGATFAPKITVSDTEDLVVGETVEVNGVGFLPTSLGTRPPLLNSGAGVYAIFGRFAETWQPSAGAPSSARLVIDQRWALPASSYLTMGGETNPELVRIQPDGSFTTTLTVATSEAGANPYGVAVYPGSGAVNAHQEILVPVTLAAPVEQPVN